MAQRSSLAVAPAQAPDRPGVADLFTAFDHPVLVATEGRLRGCTRMRVVTTNDNKGAVAAYQRYGFTITDVREGAVDAARHLKPEIPPDIHDEIELEMGL